MNRHDFDLFRETSQHGNMRFHLMLHEYISDTSRPERVSAHWHEEYELLTVTNGRGVAHINSRRFEFGQGDVLFIDSGSLHSLSAAPDTPLVFYAVDFGRELISSYGNDDIQQKYIHRQATGGLLFRDHFRAGEADCEQLRAPLEEIRRLYRMGAVGNELLIKAELLRIWHCLCQYPATLPSSEQQSGDAKITLIKDVLQFIQANYNSALTLGMLARRFYMSEGQFCRFFKSQVNMTFMEYLNYYRVGAACDMLRDGALPVSAIALDCGYGNVSYFNRTFRKYMHCTPKEYRKREGKGL
ncbi:MAG: AraC family transcriptional regulator [Butyrivibrio sp.]|nr:AraC family transcriptional regulator [Butyrivibrio sp.]